MLIYKSPRLAKRIAIRSADKPMTFLQKRALNLLAIPLVLNGMFIKKVDLKQYYVVSDQNTRDIKIGKDNLVVFTSNEFLKRIGRIDTAKKILRYVLNSYAFLDFCSMLNSKEYSTEQIKQEMLENKFLSERDNIIMLFLSTQEVANS